MLLLKHVRSSLQAGLSLQRPVPNAGTAVCIESFCLKRKEFAEAGNFCAKPPVEPRVLLQDGGSAAGAGEEEGEEDSKRKKMKDGLASFFGKTPKKDQ